jgi:hypothetical protein
MRELALICAGTAAIALTGCVATSNVTPAEQPLAPGTSYSFVGTVNGEHSYRDRIIRFTQTVEGTLAVDTAGVRLTTTHPSCLGSRITSELRMIGSDYRIDCGDVRLLLRPTDGRITDAFLSVFLTQDYDVATCVTATRSNPRTGVRPEGCLEQTWHRSQRQVWSREAPLALSTDPAP